MKRGKHYRTIFTPTKQHGHWIAFAIRFDIRNKGLKGLA